MVRFAVGVCYGRSKPPPYELASVLAIEVRFAVIVDNGAPGTSPPTNKVFVSAIEVRFAVSVRNTSSTTASGGPPSPSGEGRV